jgi:hypothetical protein
MVDCHGVAREVDPRRCRYGAMVRAGRQPQTGQVQLAMLGVPQVAGIRHHDTADGAEPPDNFLRLGEASHMGIAGGEIAIRRREARILLHREEQFRHGLIEPPSQEMRLAYQRKRRANAGARTETQRGLGTLDREVGLARE